MKFTGERFVPDDARIEDEIGYEHLHRYYAASRLVQGKKVLDLACGEGYGSVILANCAENVTGIDIDEESIKWATEKYTPLHANLHFRQGNAISIPCSSHAFDVVVSFETIEHMDADMQDQFMQEIKRVLCTDGILLMSTPDKKNYSDRYHHTNTFHVKEFYREEFAGFIKKYFTHSVFFDQGYEIVSIISNPETQKTGTVNLYNWKENQHTERKYIIAVASDKGLPEYTNTLSSVVPETDKEFLLLMDRLIAMNTEIESLGQWGKTLDGEILEAKLKIESQDKALQQYEKLLEQSRLESAQKDQLLRESERLTKYNEYLADQSGQQLQVSNQLLKEKENILLKQSLTIKAMAEAKKKSAAETLQCKQKINEQELITAEIHQKFHLLYQENNKTKERLAEIYDSDGWKLLSRYYKLKGKILPEQSQRYKKLRALFNLLRFRPSVKKGYPENYRTNTDNFLPIPATPAVFAPLTLPVFDYPLVSIIIPAYNAWAMNYMCISSIIENTQGVAYEVILADDCSADETKNCTDIIKNIVHVRNVQNLGFLKNCNYASGFAKGKYILFLNNDTRVNPNWLSTLVELMERDDSIGMAGSKLIYPDGRLQEAGGIIWNDASGWNYGHKQDPQLPEFNYVKESDYISGASIIIRKKSWLEAGGFDERYSPAYCEDSDLAFTLRSIGYKVMYQPLSEVIHYEGYSHGTDETLSENNKSVKSYQKINNSKFFEKWRQVLTKEQFPNAQNVFQARDRSTRRKTILIIDHYVPHFDKDAGSKTTFQYLELFASLDLNIKFIGDNFFKHEPYTTTLQQMGIEVLYGSWYRDNWQQWIKDNHQYIDYIYINRPHISIKYIDFLKQFTRAKILYYGHDLHFLRDQMQYEIDKDPKLLKSAQKWKETEMYLFENADIILTPSAEENKIISSLNDSFHVETILPYFFKAGANPVNNFSERADILFVGGFGHTPNLDAVEWFCRDVWPLVIKDLPGAKFIVVGSNPPDAVKNLQSATIEIMGFVSDKELSSLYEKVKVVVIPLRYGAGVKGKTVEAMYHGLPIVSTSFGIEGMPGDYLHFLHPVNQPEEFAGEITRLYKNDHLLTALSLVETNYINEHFTQQIAAAKMKDMLGLNG